jgi:hypothetical protein
MNEATPCQITVIEVEDPRFHAIVRGDDVLLKELLAKNPGHAKHLVFSLPGTHTKQDVWACERIYKNKLGTRAHGLNANYPASASVHSRKVHALTMLSKHGSTDMAGSGSLMGFQ